ALVGSQVRAPRRRAHLRGAGGISNQPLAGRPYAGNQMLAGSVIYAMTTIRFDPANARLAAVRDSLAELHRALLDAERRDIEREVGRLSPGEYLQMLLHNPRFAWLRPVGRMVRTLDGAMHAARTAAAHMA